MYSSYFVNLIMPSIYEGLKSPVENRTSLVAVSADLLTCWHANELPDPTELNVEHYVAMVTATKVTGKQELVLWETLSYKAPLQSNVS